MCQNIANSHDLQAESSNFRSSSLYMLIGILFKKHGWYVFSKDGCGTYDAQVEKFYLVGQGFLLYENVLILIIYFPYDLGSDW